MGMGLAMKMGAQLVNVGDLCLGVWLHTGDDPSPDEWSAGCRVVVDFARENRGDFARFRALIVTDGGTPDALQRKELFGGALRGHPVKTAVVTEAVTTNALKRGIATALAWMNPNCRVFEPTELAAALQHVDLDASHLDPVWACLTSLQASLQPNTTLRRIAVRHRLASPTPVPRPLSEPPRSSGVLRAVKAARSQSYERENDGGQPATEDAETSSARKA
jgi:hypothetical protein